MPAKGDIKKNASKETVRQRAKNRKPKHKKKRAETGAARLQAGLKPKKGNVGNPARRAEMDHKSDGSIGLSSHKTNRSRNNNKNHKKGKK